jgi:hypothetical protein
MSTIGNKAATQHVSLQKQTITGNGGTSYSLQQSVGSALDIAVFVNNTRQEPTTAYSASGTTLTMTGAVNASDHFYVLFLGKAITTTGLPVDAVATANINASAITNAKIANSTIDLTSKVTGVLPTARGGTGDAAGAGFVKLFESDFGSSAGGGSITHYDIDSTYINSTYDAYDIIGYFRPSGDNRYLYMKLMTGGSVISSSHLGYEGLYAAGGSNSFGGNTENHFGFQFAGSGTAEGRGTKLHARVSNVNNTTAPCSITASVNYLEHTGGAHQGSYMCGSMIDGQQATVINGFRFQFHTGNIHGGDVTIYGLK